MCCTAESENANTPTVTIKAKGFTSLDFGQTKSVYKKKKCLRFDIGRKSENVFFSDFTIISLFLVYLPWLYNK